MHNNVEYQFVDCFISLESLPIAYVYLHNGKY